MGSPDSPEEKGLIPRICHELFELIDSRNSSNLTFNVEVSYMEIYCERVRDLLAPSNHSGNLRVREHPSMGPYVEDLSKLAVSSFAEIQTLMEQGNRVRTTAATNMNETSSRSHAVFTIVLSQRRFDVETQLSTEMISRLCLVDLAGSERVIATGATGDRLKEGANINKSLTTLGKVISALADQSSKKTPDSVFIPYRDSVLTWLLKDSLGGNSKTTIIATVSPGKILIEMFMFKCVCSSILADIHFDETLSTLRYADRAKCIMNKAVVNEDPNAKIIRELKEEVAFLRERLKNYNLVDGVPAGLITDGVMDQKLIDELKDQLQSAEKLMAELNESWEEKLRKTQQLAAEREKALEELGITLKHCENSGAFVGFSSPQRVPHLVNLNEDPLMAEYLVYPLPKGKSFVGSAPIHEKGVNNIQLSGESINERHCIFENDGSCVTVIPISQNLVFVNGRIITEPHRLRTGHRIMIGSQHIFRFNHPEEARRERNLMRSNHGISSHTNNPDIHQGSPISSTSFLESDTEQAYVQPRLSTSDSALHDIHESSYESLKGASDILQEEAMMSNLVIHSLDERKQESPQSQIRSIISHWKKYRDRSLLSTMDKYRSMLKEANIISIELKKDVRFSFAINGPVPLYNVFSFWDRDRACVLNDSCSEKNNDISIRNMTEPSVCVLVHDFFHNMQYFWTLEKLDVKLGKMRNMYNLQEFALKQGTSQGLVIEEEDPFHEAKARGLRDKLQYELSGFVEISLSKLVPGISWAGTCPILCRKTFKVIAECELQIMPGSHFVDGNEAVLEICISSVTGRETIDGFHLQFRLSSFDPSVEMNSDDDKLFCSEPQNLTSDSHCNINLNQVVRIPWNDSTLRFWQSSHVYIECFSAISTGNWTKHTEKATIDSTPSEAVSSRVESSTNHHDISAWIEICELAACGDYLPVPVLVDSTFQNDPGLFLIRQGVQRRIVLTLTTDSGESISWRQISQVRISKLRFCEQKGSQKYYGPIDANSFDLTLRILPTQKYLPKTKSGRSLLWAEAAWDSSLHESILLNRVTNSDGHHSCRVIATLQWFVDVEGCSDAVSFESDLYFEVHARDGREVINAQSHRSPFKFSLFSSRIFRNIEKASFQYELTVKKNSAYLPMSYVRGEERLKGIVFPERECIDVYFDLCKKLSTIRQVIETRNMLEHSQTIRQRTGTWSRPELILQIWQRKPLCALLSSETLTAVRKLRTVSVAEKIDTKTRATAQLIPYSDLVSCSGFLKYPEQPGISEVWVKRWFVLRRPFIFIYDDSSETTERGAISLSDCKTQWVLPELEDILHVSFHLRFQFDLFNLFLFSANTYSVCIQNTMATCFKPNHKR